MPLFAYIQSTTKHTKISLTPFWSRQGRHPTKKNILENGFPFSLFSFFPKFEQRLVATASTGTRDHSFVGLHAWIVDFLLILATAPQKTTSIRPQQILTFSGNHFSVIIGIPYSKTFLHIKLILTRAGKIITKRRRVC